MTAAPVQTETPCSSRLQQLRHLAHPLESLVPSRESASQVLADVTWLQMSVVTAIWL